MKHLLRRALGSGCVACFLVAGLGCAQPGIAPASTAAAATPPGSTTTKAFETKLANGLTVIVKPDRRAPTAVHMLWVRVGAMDEVDGSSGIAHLLEHMLFKG